MVALNENGTVKLLLAATIATAALVASCGESANEPLSGSSAPTPCATVVEDCIANRLADVTLTDGQTQGAFGPVDGMDLSGIISFDDALRRAAVQDGHLDAMTVQVTLGSADASQLHWGAGTNLYYGVDWGGVCNPVIGPSPAPGASPQPSCTGGDWVTVIDAHTGGFIGGGG